MAGAMVDIVIRIAINAIALIAAVELVPRVNFAGDWPQLIAIAAIFGLINAYLRPIVKTLSLPLTLVVFGVIGLLINTGLLMLLAVVSDQAGIGFKLAGWPPGNIDLDVLVTALLAALVVSIVSTVLALMRRIAPV
jgi:putative membrane protein